MASEVSEHPPLKVYSGDPDEVVGHLLDGRFLIESVLGEGGMGVVLGARHVFLDRPTAIKVLHPELLLVKEAKARFLREAKTASRLRHPNVVEITDFGVTGEGLHYLAMEYLEGSDLLAYLEEAGPLDAEEAAAIGRQVAVALAEIHEHGFVHRDLKPENVWMCEGERDGEVPRAKLLDFGIAGVVAGTESEDHQRITKTGRTLGTAAYMSPEQARGTDLDGRSDLYALGCVLWEMVVGDQAFRGSSMADIMTKHLLQMPDPPSKERASVPEWFDTVVMRALMKNPAERYPDATAMAEALAQRGADLVADPHAAATAPADGAASDGWDATPEPAADWTKAGSQRAATGLVADSPRMVPAGTVPATSIAPPLPPHQTTDDGPPVWVWLAVAVAVLGLAGAGWWFSSAGGNEGAEARSAEAAASAGAADNESQETTPVVEDAPPPAAHSPTEKTAVEESAAKKAAAEESAEADKPSEAAPGAPDAARETVLLTFAIKPAGAEVRRGDELLGKTPLALPVDKADETVTYTIEADGFEALELPVSHASNRKLGFELLASDAMGSSPRTKKASSGTKKRPTSKSPSTSSTAPRTDSKGTDSKGTGTKAPSSGSELMLPGRGSK